MRKFITILTVGLLVLPVIANGFERRVDTVRGRNGRPVQRHRFYFKDAPRYQPPSQPARTYSAPRYEAPGYQSWYRGGGYGPNYYRNYHRDYPGVNFGRYDIFPYYNTDVNYKRNFRLRHPDVYIP